jgi:type VI secretion system protein ImpJ
MTGSEWSMGQQLDTMNIKQSIFWHQGLFLQPQHFQQMEMHQQFNLHSIVNTLNPYPWGVEHIEVVESAVNNRIAELRSLKLLLPDQTYLEYPGNTLVSSRSFDKVWTDPDLPFNVYLAIRRITPGEPNVTIIDATAQASEVRTRFISLSNPGEVSDLYSGTGQAVMPTVLDVARLIFESELAGLDGYEVIPLMQLIVEGNQVRQADKQIPPLVRLDASLTLSHIVRDIRDDMLGRLRQLEEYKSPRGMNVEDLDANFMMMMQAVQVLNRHVPALTHLLEVSHVHPWHVYGQLRQCIGELSTFSARFDVYGRLPGQEDGLPPYKHEALGPCFFRAREILSQLLTEISVGPEFHVTLAFQHGMFSGTIPSDYFGKRNRFYLILQSEAVREMDIQAFLGSARLASADILPELIDHALPGLELLVLPGPPQGLPRRSDAHYFRIEQMSDGWEQIEQSGAIALDWPEAPEGLRVVLIVTKG